MKYIGQRKSILTQSVSMKKTCMIRLDSNFPLPNCIILISTFKIGISVILAQNIPNSTVILYYQKQIILMSMFKI